jgi:hypothetical protein
MREGMNKLFLVGFGAVLGFGACKLLDRARTRTATPQPVAPFAVHHDALPTVEAEALRVEAARAPSRSVKRTRKPAATTAPRRVRRKTKR